MLSPDFPRLLVYLSAVINAAALSQNSGLTQRGVLLWIAFNFVKFPKCFFILWSRTNTGWPPRSGGLSSALILIPFFKSRLLLAPFTKISLSERFFPSSFRMCQFFVNGLSLPSRFKSWYIPVSLTKKYPTM